MPMSMSRVLFAVLALATGGIGLSACSPARADEPCPATPLGNTACRLHGKVKFVTSFPDYKIQVVTSFPDIKVKKVTSFPDHPGEWQIVESFPDFKVQVVNSFPDFKVKWVDSFPGCP